MITFAKLATEAQERGVKTSKLRMKTRERRQ